MNTKNPNTACEQMSGITNQQLLRITCAAEDALNGADPILDTNFWLSIGHLCIAYESMGKHCDAVLKLAKELHQQKAHTYASENADLYRGFDNGCKYAANRINKIFSPKDGK